MTEQMSYADMCLVVDATYDSEVLKKLENTRPDLCIYTWDQEFVNECMDKISKHEDEGLVFDEP